MKSFHENSRCWQEILAFDINGVTLKSKRKKNEVPVEHFTIKCNVFNNGVAILNNRNISITIKLDPKTQIKQWDGRLYLTGDESIIFFTSLMGETYEIELMDGRKGTFHAKRIGRTIVIKGSGPLE